MESKLEINNLSVTTKEGKAVATDISISVKQGEIVILMGPNGSGKSSFLNAIMGHPKYEVTGGSIKIGDTDITQLTPEKKAKEGLFLSMQHLPEISGVPLASFLYQAKKDLTRENQSMMDFYKEASNMAQKIGVPEEFLKRSVNKGLSGGEKKLSEILQLSILKPKFALLDEIDSGVDIDALKKVFGAIKILAEEGVGFILVTHHPNVLEYIKPDMVYVMKDGKVERAGGVEIIENLKEKGFE
jgi:Fe-S cluster assembly ATP-binding protein